MKNKIEDMTHEEILALTDADLDFLVKYRCAEEGVRIAVKPNEPEKVSIPKEHAFKVYKVGSYVFKQFCDAEALAAQLNCYPLYTTDYHWPSGSEYKG